MDNSNLPYIELAEFNRRVEEFAKDNHILMALFSNPKSKIKTWEDLPPQLIQDLFRRLECKPHIEKY